MTTNLNLSSPCRYARRSRTPLWTVVAATLLGLPLAARGADRLFSAEKMALIDGRPRFIIGLYEHLKDDATLKQVADAGFNLVQCSADPARMDQVHRFGLRAWINLGGRLDLRGDVEAKRAKLVETVNRFKDHPALLVWEAPDEPLWNVSYSVVNYLYTTEFPAMGAAAKASGDKEAEIRALINRCHSRFERAQWEAFEKLRDQVWKQLGKQPPRANASLSDAVARARDLGDGLTRGFEAVRKADPGHILWLNHAPRNSIASMRHFNRAVDMAGCDIYPYPFNYRVGHSDLRDTNLTSVGAYTDRMREAAPGKGVAMVLQGFGWRDLRKEKPKDPAQGRRPDLKSTRFMAYDAIVHGASAILYWGTAYIEKDSRLWTDLLTVTRELRALEPAIVAPAVTPSPRCAADEVFGSLDGEGPRVVLKRVDQDYVLFVVNEAVHGQAFEVSGLPADLDGRTLHRLGSDEAQTVEGRSFRDGIRALEVHVYATTRTFEPPKTP